MIAKDSSAGIDSIGFAVVGQHPKSGCFLNCVGSMGMECSVFIGGLLTHVSKGYRATCM